MENALKERERQTDARLQTIEQMVREVSRAPAVDGKYDAVLGEIKTMREEAVKEREGRIVSYIGQLNKKIDELKEQPRGRSMEDLVADLGPVVADKVDRAGTAFLDEIKGLREQAIPRAQPAAHARILTVEEVAEQAQAENEILEEVNGQPEPESYEPEPEMIPEVEVIHPEPVAAG